MQDPSLRPDTRTFPVIPAQREPLWPLVGDGPEPALPEPVYPAPKRLSRRTYVAVAVVALAALAGSIGVVVLSSERQPLSAAEAIAPSTAATPLTPFDRSAKVLETQAAALLKGDEKGWLAAVDPGRPKLQARYRTLYRSLRALGISHLVYRPFMLDGSKGDTVAVGVDLSYCFSVTDCPEWTSQPGNGPPRIAQALSFKPVDGRYVITSLKDSKDPNHLQPTPWEKGDLVFAQGTRVTVAAPRSQAKHLKRVLAIADKAAVVNDRFARYVGNPQRRYRVYLADEKAWKSWYGGIDSKWTVAYAVPLNAAGTDVVLRMKELLKDRTLLATTVQHELGHVVTLGGITQRDFAQDRWLSEGIAEYIGWSPKSARASWNRASARSAFRGGKLPKSIAVKPLGPKASGSAVETFYALGHFAAACMADRYGEAKLFTFVRLALRQDNTYDQASREAFGQPFATVDKACVRWIKDEV